MHRTRQARQQWSRLSRCCLSLVVLTFSLIGPRLFGGEIRGNVLVRQPVRKDDSRIISRSIIRRYINKSPNEHESGQPHPEIVVFIEGPKHDTSNEERTVVLDQKNERFVPHVLPILVGTRVSFLNSDHVFHNVFSFSPAKTFDLGRYHQGKSRSVLFDKPGVVKVYCDIHTHMNAFILVLENKFFDVTDDAGNFLIKDVPAGNYTIKAWHGRLPEKEQRISVREEGETIVRFEFQ